jgi:hypothetical protein
MAIPTSTINSVLNLISTWNQYVDTIAKAEEKGTRITPGGKAALEKWFNSFIKPNSGGTGIQPTVTFPTPYVNKPARFLGRYIPQNRPSSSYSEYQNEWMQAYTKVRMFLLATAPSSAITELDSIYKKYSKPLRGR